MAKLSSDSDGETTDYAKGRKKREPKRFIREGMKRKGGNVATKQAGKKKQKTQESDSANSDSSVSRNSEQEAVVEEIVSLQCESEGS